MVQQQLQVSLENHKNDKIYQDKPQLRFKKFKNPWNEYYLEDCVDFLDNMRKPLKESDRNNKKGKYPYYGASGIIDFIDEYIFDDELILMGEDGANIISRNSRLIFLAKGKFWVNNHAHVFKAKQNFDSYFLAETLERLNYEKYNTGTAQPKLNQEVCAKIKIKSPTIEEQRKISNFLQNIDKKIELLEKTLSLYQKFKQEMVQKLTNPKNNEDWTKYKLKDLLIECTEKSTKNNQYPVLSSTKEGIKQQTEYFNRNIASSDNTGYKIIHKNQLVLSPQNLWLGNININEEFEIGIVSPSYKIYDLSGKIDIYFMKNIIKSPKMLYLYKTVSEQGASIVRRNLNKELFENLEIYLPSKSEQIKIGSFLNNLDIKIEMLTNKKEKTELFKKALLQKMFV